MFANCKCLPKIIISSKYLCMRSLRVCVSFRASGVVTINGCNLDEHFSTHKKYVNWRYTFIDSTCFSIQILCQMCQPTRYTIFVIIMIRLVRGVQFCLRKFIIFCGLHVISTSHRHLKWTVAEKNQIPDEKTTFEFGLKTHDLLFSCENCVCHEIWTDFWLKANCYQCIMDSISLKRIALTVWINIQFI